MKLGLKLVIIAISLTVIIVSISFAKSLEEVEQDIQEMKSRVDYKLESDKQVYRYGDPINVTTIWFNNSGEKASPDNPYWSNISVLKIIDESRNRQYDVIVPHQTKTGPYSSDVNPGQSINTTININEGFSLKPGNYQISVDPTSNGTQSSSIYIQVQE